MTLDAAEFFSRGNQSQRANKTHVIQNSTLIKSTPATYAPRKKVQRQRKKTPATSFDVANFVVFAASYFRVY